MKETEERPLVFPEWIDSLRPLVGVLLGIAPIYVLGLLYYAGSPRNLSVGYQPEQPVPYSHALHAGELGLDCRYCHTGVESSAHAAVPPTATCMNCHVTIFPESVQLAAVHESWETGLPIPWVRVHDLPDFVFFDHSAHVNRGVGCVECHGRVDHMEVVHQVEPLSMAWCLDCHRNPDPRLRPVSEVTNMAWQPSSSREALGRRLREEYGIAPSEDCSTCHR